MTAGCTRRKLSLPRFGARVLRGRRQPGRDKRGRRRQAEGLLRQAQLPLPAAVRSRAARRRRVRREAQGRIPAEPRATFVIDKDRRILASITSEVNMNTHADKALEVLRAPRR